MPEYHTIQWFIPLDQYDFPVTLTWFQQTLSQLGLLDHQTKRWLTNCVWHEHDNGIAYFDTAFDSTLTDKDTRLTVQPVILGWTPTIYPALDHHWVEYQFLFPSADLRDASQPSGYRSGILDILWTVMEHCFTSFPPTSIYLTDEAQDGQPFEGRVEQKPDAFWSFDQALIPPQLDAFQAHRPARLHCTHYTGYRRYVVHE